jgi:diaminobutyrate-2-oxoglutarate transaminase
MKLMMAQAQITQDYAAALGGSSNQYYLDRQSQFESNARSYPRRLPLAIREARGIWITDVDGRRFLDCLSNAGTLALGHNHPVVVEAIKRQLDAGLPMQTLDLTTPVKDQFVEELFSTLPAEFAANARIQFCSPSGADAVEAALKLVKTATGRRAIIAFNGAFHGQTHGALALMGNRGPKSEVNGLMPDVHFLPYPYPFRCPLTSEQCLEHAGYLLSDPENGLPPVAGMILEPVQGEGGAIPAPDEWLRGLRNLASRHDIPLILDEVQTGWGRTGRLYAFEHSGVTPDVLVLSKAIGGGLPLAVVVFREELNAWNPGAHTGTFRGNQLAMAAGLATLRFLIENDIPDYAEAIGELFRAGLRELQDRHPFIGEVRGRGLMLGVEIIDPEETDATGRPRGAGDLARKIQSECFSRGLILEVGGRHGAVLRLLPPLIITPEQTDQVCCILADACAVVGAEEYAYV